jgi:hypothetical protein
MEGQLHVVFDYSDYHLTSSSKDHTPRTTRAGIMQSITKRLQSPHRPYENRAAELPIQRVPSLRRQPSRLSHRSSRVRSYRNSGHRLSSTRLSRASSCMTFSGQSTRARPTSGLIASESSPTIGTAAEQDIDSNYSTESEADEAPITMRSVRLQRVRASAITIGPTIVVENEEPPQSLPPARTPLADLIEEITEELEGRPSRDTMDSAWDFSLDHYCKAFPAPPSPGVAPNGLFASSEKIFPKIEPPLGNVAGGHSAQSSFSGDSRPVEVGPLDNLTTPQPDLAVLNQEPEDWNNWSFPDMTPSLKLVSSASSASSVSKSESFEMVTNTDQRPKPSRVVHQHQQSSISTLHSSTPVTPATPSFARPRSADPLAQARRKTRIVFGHVVDGVDDGLVVTNDGATTTLRAGRSSPLWWGSSAGLNEGQPSLYRRGSDKSSVLSLVTPDQPNAYEGNLGVASFDNFYSLNSPQEEVSDIGIALTTESRQLASAAPISTVEQEDARLTLFARRKGRQANESLSKGHLRLDPATPMPSLPEHAATTTSYNNLQSAGVHEAALPTNNIRNDSLTGRAFAPSPPTSAPPKRRSFFRYPFLSSRRSNSNLKLLNTSIGRTASPPLASPRAVEPPMSASARNNSFSFLNHSAVASLSGSSSKSRPGTPPKFRSFSRPSSSGKII